MTTTGGNEYDNARQELINALKKKKQFDKQLVVLFSIHMIYYI